MTNRYTNYESVYQFAKELCKEKETGAYAKGYNNALHAIMSAARSEAIPAADVAPVVRGRWIWIGEKGFSKTYACSLCHRMIEHDGIDCLLTVYYPFCHCGADMREVDDED